MPARIPPSVPLPRVAQHLADEDVRLVGDAVPRARSTASAARTTVPMQCVPWPCPSWAGSPGDERLRRHVAAGEVRVARSNPVSSTATAMPLPDRGDDIGLHRLDAPGRLRRCPGTTAAAARRPSAPCRRARRRAAGARPGRRRRRGRPGCTRGRPAARGGPAPGDTDSTRRPVPPPACSVAICAGSAETTAMPRFGEDRRLRAPAWPRRHSPRRRSRGCRRRWRCRRRRQVDGASSSSSAKTTICRPVVSGWITAPTRPSTMFPFSEAKRGSITVPPHR